MYIQLICDQSVISLPHWKPIPAIQLLVSCIQGRPKSGPEDKFRLAPVAPVLAAKLGSPVNTVSDCIGEEVAAAVAAAPNGSVRPSTSPLLFLVPAVCVPMVSAQRAYGSLQRAALDYLLPKALEYLLDSARAFVPRA